jgi:multidrug resistance efflux pump
MLVVVLRGVLAPSPTVPRATDVQEAAAEVAPAEGGVDERVVRPEGDWVSGNGVVEPADREIRLAAAVPGRIAEVVVREGQRVAAGEVLIRLDQALEVAALRTAEAERAAALSALASLSHGSRRQEVAAAAADANAAEVRARASQDALRRATALVGQGAVTDDAAAQAAFTADADAAQASAARQRASLVAAGARSEAIAEAQARVTAASARVEEARVRLEQRTVRAPVGGEVLQILVRPGEYQQPGGPEPLLLLGDTSTLRVRLDLDERDLSRVAVGSTAIARAVAAPATDHAATVTEIGRRMGRKNVRTDDPVDRNDTKVLEVVLTLEGEPALVVGQRVTVYVSAASR